MNALDHDTLPRFIGVLHLLPLPGGPRPSPGLDACTTRAVEDARALVAGGADAAILENLGDAPATSERVDADTVAYMTRIALAVRDACPNLRSGSTYYATMHALRWPSLLQSAPPSFGSMSS